ncbi:MAG: zinc-binding dehydrogenase [Alphaproteobacteria bacterium]
MNAAPPPPSTFQRVRIHRPGGYHRLRLEPFSPPAPGPGQVRVRTRAIGVNFADGLVRMGVYAPARRDVGWPITPGFELAGEIDAVGPDLDPTDHLGRPVVALTRFDAYAEAVTVDAALTFPLPAGWSMAAGAAVPVQALTARHALRLAGAPAGSPVLVHSAAGGVGHWLVQLARADGLAVTGSVGRGEKCRAVRGLGARHCLVRDGAADRTDATAYQAVFDAQGPASWRRSYRRLAPTGRLVVYGAHGLTGGGGVRWWRSGWAYLTRPRFDPMRLCADNRGVLGFNLAYLFDRRAEMRADLAAVTALVDAGTVRLPPIATLPLAEVAEAHRRLESGATVGKLVLVTEA